jgi:hypothetical protein
MEGDHWASIAYQGVNVPAPLTYSRFAPVPLPVGTDTFRMSMYTGLPRFKPSYLWVADAGEEVSFGRFRDLRVHAGIRALNREQLLYIRILNAHSTLRNHSMVW